MEIATNMRHSDIKDRKRRAVKRAPKVKTYARAFKPNVFITTNLPERLAEEDGRFSPPEKRRKTKRNNSETYFVSAVMKRPGGFFCSKRCGSAPRFRYLWGQRGLEEHTPLPLGLSGQKSSKFGPFPRSNPSATKGRGSRAATPFHSPKTRRKQFIFTLLGKFGHKLKKKKNNRKINLSVVSRTHSILFK